MKKNYFMIAAAATLFAACAETDVINDVNVENAPQAIGFETFANKVTRAEGDATSLDAHHTSFNVWASKKIIDSYKQVYSTTTPGRVTYSNNVWTASPLKYWDKTATEYYFYAASPVGIWTYENATEDDYSTGYLTLDYTLSGTNLANGTSDVLVGTWLNNEGADKDLMVAIPTSEDRDFFAGENDPEAVDLTFIHILSKLNISVQKEDKVELENVTITLKRLDVVDLYCDGDFTGTDLGTAISNGGVITHWTNQSSKYDLAAGIDNNGLVLGDKVYTHEYLIMPQSQDKADGITNNANAPTNDAAYLHIVYTVSGTEGDSEEFEAYYGLADVLATANEPAFNFNEGWQNTLNITISPDIIAFDVEESVWDSPANSGSATID